MTSQGITSHTGTRIATHAEDDFTWWRVAGIDHAFRVVGAWMHSACPGRVRWTAGLDPVDMPANPCFECMAMVSPESERRLMDGNR